MKPSTPPPGKIKTGKLSLLGGFCFFLSALEYMVPKPLPFIRLGLANLPILLALDIMPFSSFMLLGGLKVIGQALISGTLFSYVFIFSLGGTGVSILVMYALRRGLGQKRISLIGISAAGALASNGVQLVLAYYFVLGDSVRYAAAPILALGIVTGTLLGAGAEYFIRHSRWYAQAANYSLASDTGMITDESLAADGSLTGEEERAVPKKLPGRFRKTREAFYRKTFRAEELALAGLCMVPALLLNPDTGARVVQFLFFWALAWLAGKKNNPLITISVVIGIVFFNLLVPYGEILFAIGPLKISSGALQGGIRRAVTLEGLFMLSRCCVSRDISLPGAFGEIVGEAFRIFSVMAEERRLFSRKNWTGQLDRLLISLDRGTGEAKKTGPESISRPRNRSSGSIIILALAIILAWLPFIIREFPRP